MPFVIQFEPLKLAILLSEDPSLILPGLCVMSGSLRHYDPEAEISRWPDGAEGPETWLGQDPRRPSDFAIFASEAQLRTAGFEHVASSYVQARRFEKLEPNLKSKLLQASTSTAR